MTIINDSENIVFGYTSQIPFILNETLRLNILMKKEKYKNVIYASALNHDLKRLSESDLTEIGSEGMNISHYFDELIVLDKGKIVIQTSRHKLANNYDNIMHKYKNLLPEDINLKQLSNSIRLRLSK